VGNGTWPEYQGRVGAALEFSQQNAKRWLKFFNDYWLGGTKTYLCGKQITIAEHFAVGIMTPGEIIGVDFAPYPNADAIWPARSGERPEVRHPYMTRVVAMLRARLPRSGA